MAAALLLHQDTMCPKFHSHGPAVTPAGASQGADEAEQPRCSHACGEELHTPRGRSGQGVTTAAPPGSCSPVGLRQLNHGKCTNSHCKEAMTQRRRLAEIPVSSLSRQGWLACYSQSSHHPLSLSLPVWPEWKSQLGKPAQGWLRDF